MTPKAIFEVCAFNVQSAIIAENAGAARVELCDNPVEGGTTPSYGAIKQTRERISILLYPIIRPRSGNYLYDEDEFEIIHQDILVCKELGCDGISVGVQKIDGEIDTDRLKQIVEWAHPMGVTCNRAFDATPDPFKALEDIISTGCERILTSGQQSGAPDAGEILHQLVQQAGDRIIIMPGAGIKSSNITQLREESGAKAFHGSARKATTNPMQFANPLVTDFGNVYIADEEEVGKIVELLKN
jgi:copper homeostasis protein